MELWEKSETIPPDVRAHIESLVTALGGRSTYDDSYCKRITENVLGRLANR
jgi:replication fork protection complex subunit Tof1/Swi1